MKETNFISAVIYVSHGAAKAPEFIAEIDAVLSAGFRDYEIICINDDADTEIIKALHNIRLAYNCGNFVIINMGGYCGLERSMVAGVDFAIGDYVFEFDSVDRDYPLDIIMTVYTTIFKGYDVVAAQKDSKSVALLSRFFYYLFNKNSEFEEKLRSESFCIKSRRAINQAGDYGNIILYRKAADSASGLKRGYVSYEAIKPICREAADWDRVETAADAIILFTNMAFKLSLTFSALMAMIMLGFGIYVIVIYFSSYKQVEGWAPIMGVLCLGFFGVFVLMTNLLKHVEMVLELQFRKKPYMISSIEKVEERQDA